MCSALKDNAQCYEDTVDKVAQWFNAYYYIYKIPVFNHDIILFRYIFPPNFLQTFSQSMVQKSLGTAVLKYIRVYNKYLRIV